MINIWFFKAGNLKNILTRTGGAPALSRSGIKAHSARELRGDYSPSDADCFVTRSRVHHNWPEVFFFCCGLLFLFFVFVFWCVFLEREER